VRTNTGKIVGKKVFTGQVVSDKMDKTITVRVESRKLHPLYKKYVMQSVKYKAHDENNDAKIGDTVRVIESRPLSKDKRWRLLEIVERAK
jgi:small subunit ribosomal protein S17